MWFCRNAESSCNEVCERTRDSGVSELVKVVEVTGTRGPQGSRRPQSFGLTFFGLIPCGQFSLVWATSLVWAASR